MAELDKVALRETLDRVIAADAARQWNQNHWALPQATNRDALDDDSVCGTAQCFAGWRLVLDGYHTVGVDAMENAQGVHVYGLSIGRQAQDRLGLTEKQGDLLFDGDNSLERLKELVDELCDGS